jgi:hypothetical protein
MTHDDEEDILAKVPLDAWRVPPPSTVDRASILARALAPVAAPKRARGAWLLAAMALANVLLAAFLVIILAERPSQTTVTVRPAGGGGNDPLVTQLLARLTQEEADLQAKLVEVQQLRSTVEQLAEKVRDCDQTVKRDKPSVPTPAPVPVAPDVAGCDEVSCVLNNYDGACCAKYKRTSGLPESLDRAAISSGIAAVKSQVAACGGSSKGIVKLHVRVAPVGKVTNIDVAATPDGALGACVAAAVQKAVFRATQQGGSFSYPFVF